MRWQPPKVQVIEVTVAYTNRDIVYQLKEVTEPCSSLGWAAILRVLCSVLGKSMNLGGSCQTELPGEW